MRQKTIFTIALLSFLISCSIPRQIAETKRFRNSNFTFGSIENIKIAGVTIPEMASLTKLPILQMAKITSAIAQGTLPVEFRVNIIAINTQPKLAAMNRFDWKLYMEDQELIKGALLKRVEIPARGMTTFPIEVEMDLKKVFKKQTGGDLLQLAMNMIGIAKNSSKITIKARPSISLGLIDIKSPRYITITKEYGKK